MQSWILFVAQPLGIGLAVIGYFATKAPWRSYLINAWRRRNVSPTAR